MHCHPQLVQTVPSSLHHGRRQALLGPAPGHRPVSTGTKSARPCKTPRRPRCSCSAAGHSWLCPLTIRPASTSSQQGPKFTSPFSSVRALQARSLRIQFFNFSLRAEACRSFSSAGYTVHYCFRICHQSGTISQHPREDRSPSLRQLL